MTTEVVQRKRVSLARKTTFLIFISILELLFLYYDQYFIPIHDPRIRGFISMLITGLIWIPVVKVLSPTALAYLKPQRIKLEGLLGLLVLIAMSDVSSYILHLKWGSWTHIVSGIFYILAIGVSEELSCRFFFFNYLKPNGIYKAAFISSALFALMHAPHIFTWKYPSDAFIQISTAFGFGMLAVGITVLTKMIYPAIVIHALNDITTSFPITHAPVAKVTPYHFPLLELIIQVAIMVGFGLLMIWYQLRLERKRIRIVV